MSRSHSLGLEKSPNPRSSKADSSYEKYKENLHAIFDGLAPLPACLRENNDQGETLEPKKPPTSPSQKSSRRLSQAHNPYSLFTEALKRAATPEEIRRAVDALQEAEHPFPMDEELLSKALTYPSEDIVLSILDKLEAVLEKSISKNPRLLASRLDDAAFSSRPGAARDRILALKSKIRS